jgi:hypothetical protein
MEGQAPSQPDDPGATVREQAIDLFISGRSPTAICRQLKRSRPWFYTAHGDKLRFLRRSPRSVI